MHRRLFVQLPNIFHCQAHYHGSEPFPINRPALQGLTGDETAPGCPPRLGHKSFRPHSEMPQKQRARCYDAWGAPLFKEPPLPELTGPILGDFPGEVSMPGYVLLCPYSLWASFLQKEDAHPHESGWEDCLSHVKCTAAGLPAAQWHCGSEHPSVSPC